MTRSADLNLCYPVLLVHGLFSNSRTWRKTVKIFSADYDLRFGGEVSAATGAAAPEPAAADFYTWNFSSNRNLSYRQQAEELLIGIEKIKAANGSSKVVLVGHSMGGLAARAVVQLCNSADVFALITLGTPHYGSPLASLRDSSERGAQKVFSRMRKSLGKADVQSEGRQGFWMRFLRRIFRVTSEAETEVNRFFSSEAFIELAPGSAALEELNAAPLPGKIRYAFITGSLTGFMARTLGGLSNRYFAGPYKFFAEYAGKYSPGIREASIEELMDFDGVVPVLSQVISHFSVPPRVRAVLPVNASHTQLTTKAAKIFQALAVCGVVARDSAE